MYYNIYSLISKPKKEGAKVTKNTEQIVRELLKKHVKSNVNFEEISSSESLEDTGMNSIDFIKIIADIEMEYEIIFPDDELDFKNYSSIDDMVRYIDLQVALK